MRLNFCTEYDDENSTLEEFQKHRSIFGVFSCLDFFLMMHHDANLNLEPKTTSICEVHLEYA
jgi:hypothetical protein